MSKNKKSEAGQRSSNFSGYSLFSEEFKMGKLKSFQEVGMTLGEAWNNLEDEQKDDYRKRAKELRAPPKGDKFSCGVHVLLWLQFWDGEAQDEEGYTMPNYSEEDLHQVRVDCLWWLVTHQNNSVREEVLSIAHGEHPTKRRS